MNAERPTIADFRIGAVYGTAFVASFLGRSSFCVRKMVARGTLKGVIPPGCRDYVITGESVREFYGRLKLAEDAASEAPERARDLTKAANAGLKRLESRKAQRAKVTA